MAIARTLVLGARDNDAARLYEQVEAYVDGRLLGAGLEDGGGRCVVQLRDIETRVGAACEAWVRTRVLLRYSAAGWNTSLYDGPDGARFEFS